MSHKPKSLWDFFEGVRVKDKKSGKDKLKKPVNLELLAIQLNINPGYNEKLKRECPELMGYVAYWEKVRRRKEAGEALEEAVKNAVDECIVEGILADFFRKNKAEVVKMSIYEFDQEEYEQAVREEGKEEQRKEDEKILADVVAKKDEVIAEKDRQIEELKRKVAALQ